MGVIVIIALSFVMGTETKYLWGYFYGIMAALLGTLFTLFNAKYIKKVGAAQITMIEMLSGLIIISAMVFVWMTEIMRHITPFSLIMAINLEPIYSIILALLIFGESELMSTAFYIGSTIIIGIVFLDGYLKNKQ